MAQAMLRSVWRRIWLIVVHVLADGGAGQFAMPMMLASIHQLPAASLGDGSTATITLIARRAVHRVGTRHWRRGADPEVPCRLTSLALHLPASRPVESY